MTMMVACPICRTPVEWCSENRYRPFCSERCKLVDLGEWADESRAIPALPADFDLRGLTDSKKLSEKKRDELAVQIKAQATAYCVARADVDEIARLNILHATMLAMKRAVQGLEKQPAKVWIDGNRVPPDLGVPAECVVKGDAKIAAISAASVLAKVARDAEMYALHERYPQYGFAQHKGYGTAAHLAALAQFGALPEHRADFAPVKLVLAQGRLFG